MGAPNIWPSDSRAFSPDTRELPIVGPSEPVLGKVFNFNAIPRRPMRTPPPPVYDDPVMATSAPPAPPNKPPVVATGAAADEPEKIKISPERLEFLERVEELMAVKSQVADLKTENKTLISIVSRLQRELDQLKGAHKA